MEYLKFNCGCQFPILNREPLQIDFNPNIENISLDCSATWDLISEGNTIGCFQLEGRLGQQLAKRLKPHNIKELSDLISLMRPGCLESLVDGKSVTNHYIDRKHGKDIVSYYHSSLEPILKDNKGLIIYQEDCLRIATDIAGFTLEEADSLRKAIGKKLPALMAKIKQQFIDGCLKVGKVNNDEAIQLFDWIEKSQRYSFCAAHGTEYALDCYMSAFCKAHFPRVFFTSYLDYAKEKINPKEEIANLVNNARQMSIVVNGPDIRRLNKRFELIDKEIYFGLGQIKGIGENSFEKLMNGLSKLKSIKEMKWLELLFQTTEFISSSVFEALIKSGALSWIGLSRQKMLFEYAIFQKLTDKELAGLLPVSTDVSSLTELLQKVVDMPTGRGQILSSSKRQEVVRGLLRALIAPPHSLDDFPEWIANIEESLLGIAFTCSKIEACDTGSANMNCNDFLNSSVKNGIIIAAQLDDVREITTKTNKQMAFIKLSDITGIIDGGVVFPEVFLETKHMLIKGNTLLLSGERGKDKNSFLIQKIWQI